MAVDYTVIKSDWLTIKDANINDLYIGLCSVSKHLNTFFIQSMDLDEKMLFFQNIYNQVYQDNSQSAQVDSDNKLINEVDFRAANFIAQEINNGIVEEGKQLFRAYSQVFQSTICSSQGVLGTLYKGFINTEELPILIATHILNNFLSNKQYWYAFALFIGCIINKQSIEKFCESI